MCIEGISACWVWMDGAVECDFAEMAISGELRVTSCECRGARGQSVRMAGALV